MKTYGEILTRRAGSAEDDIFLCAPFVKRNTIARILQNVTALELSVYTRWRAEEVAAGVSDTSVFDEVTSRNGRVSLCDPVHAKYFRFDDVAFVGSANLTGAAMGWSRSPNLELLVEVNPLSKEVEAFERRLVESSIAATADMAAAIEAAAALLPSPPPADAAPAEPVWDAAGLDAFMPTLREPKDLIRAYANGPQVLASGPASAATTDLRTLDLPPGLSGRAFRATVASRLIQARQVASIDRLLESPQRFGAIRDVISRDQGISRDEAERCWQTLMRWMLEFMPERYELAVPRHSEMMQRRMG